MGEYHDEKRRLNESILGNAFLALFELALGFLANSTSVISLGFHDFSDVITSLLARFSVSQAEKPADSKMSFGYYRMTILGALLNSVVLVVLTLFVIYEGIQRLMNPVHVDVGLVTLVAVISMAANGVIAYRLLKNNRDLNIRALFWHIAGDFLGGIVVLLVAVVTALYDWHYSDGLATIIVSLIVLKGVWGIFSEVFEIMMEATPRGINVDHVRKAVKKVPGVKGVHDLHVWTLGSLIYCLSAHIQVNDARLTKLDEVTRKVKTVLSRKFNITHSTIELECADCNHDGF